MKTSRISSRLTPFVNAPAMCRRSSCGRFRQLIIARFSKLRVFLSSPSRPHTAPQQYSVTSSCIGMLKSSACLNALSTNSLPSTELRMARPFSNVALSICVLVYRLWALVFGRLLNLDAGPLFDDLRDACEVGIGAELCLRDRQHLTNRRTRDHRHTQRLGLVDAQPHVLVRQARRESEVEGARQDRSRELVLRRAVAPAAGVDDVDQDLRVETRLHAHRHRF